MAINETRCHYRPGAQLPLRAVGTVLAKRFVTPAGPRDALDGENIPVKTAVAGGWAIGVPAHDQTDGKVVTGYCGPGYHPRVQCGAAIDASAGAVALMVGTGGRAIPHTGTNVIVAYGLSTTTAVDQEVEVRLV